MGLISQCGDGESTTAMTTTQGRVGGRDAARSGPGLVVSRGIPLPRRGALDLASLAGDQGQGLTRGAVSLGVGPEDRVALASGTRMEWILADLAIMCAGAATTTIYPTTQHEDVAFILGIQGPK